MKGLIHHRSGAAEQSGQELDHVDYAVGDDGGDNRLFRTVSLEFLSLYPKYNDPILTAPCGLD